MLYFYDNLYENKTPFIHKKLFQILSDSFHQEAFSSITAIHSKLRTYGILKNKIGIENYLLKIRNPETRRTVSKFRLSNHNLNIEKGRHIFTKDGKEFWFEVFIYGGKKGTELDAIEWAKQVETYGAGEILLTSIDRDGTKDGYDTLITQEIVNSVSIPVIASGGCGKPEHMIDIFKNTGVSAALAASIFHYETHSVNRVKQMIKEEGIEVRY